MTRVSAGYRRIATSVSDRRGETQKPCQLSTSSEPWNRRLPQRTTSFTKTVFPNGLVCEVGKLKGVNYFHDVPHSCHIQVLFSFPNSVLIDSSDIQYAIQWIIRSWDLHRTERFIRLERAAAYAPKSIPTRGKPKVGVPPADCSEEVWSNGRLVGRWLRCRYRMPRFLKVIRSLGCQRWCQATIPSPHVRDTCLIFLLGMVLSRLKITRSDVVDHSNAQREFDAAESGNGQMAM